MATRIEGRTVIIVGPESVGKSRVAKTLIIQNPLGRSVLVPYRNRKYTSKQDKKQEKDRDTLIAQAIKHELFLVINCEGLSVDEIKAIIEFCQNKNLFRKIQIIKMNLPEELHDQIRVRNHEKITKEMMLKEREEFAKTILAEDFSNLNILQTELANPYDMEFDFD